MWGVNDAPGAAILATVDDGEHCMVNVHNAAPCGLKRDREPLRESREVECRESDQMPRHQQLGGAAIDEDLIVQDLPLERFRVRKFVRKGPRPTTRRVGELHEERLVETEPFGAPDARGVNPFDSVAERRRYRLHVKRRPGGFG